MKCSSFSERRKIVLEREMNDICADVQEGGSWAQHRNRYRTLADRLEALISGGR